MISREIYRNPYYSILILLSLLFIPDGKEGVSVKSGIDGVSPEIQASFAKLIPQFNRETCLITLKTDERITLDPTSFTMVPFLTQYAALAQKIIKNADLSGLPSSTRKDMNTYFSLKYGNFLREVGVPLGCLSYYAGAAELSSLREMEALVPELEGQGQSKEKVKTPFDLLGKETGEGLVDLLDLKAASIQSLEETSSSASGAECDNIFWTLQDDTTVAHLPTMDNTQNKIWMPNKEKRMSIFGTNATNAIEEYALQGLGCLTDTEGKMNFSSTLVKWISLKVVPQIMQNPACVEGFPSILKLLVTLREYRDYLGQYGGSESGEFDEFGTFKPASKRPRSRPEKSAATDSDSGKFFIILLLLILAVLPCCCCGCIFFFCCQDPECRRSIRCRLAALIKKLKGCKKFASSQDYEPLSSSSSSDEEEVEKCTESRQKRNPQITIPVHPGKRTTVTIDEHLKRERECFDTQVYENSITNCSDYVSQELYAYGYGCSDSDSFNDQYQNQNECRPCYESSPIPEVEPCCCCQCQIRNDERPYEFSSDSSPRFPPSKSKSRRRSPSNLRRSRNKEAKSKLNSKSKEKGIKGQRRGNGKEDTIKSKQKQRRRDQDVPLPPEDRKRTPAAAEPPSAPIDRWTYVNPKYPAIREKVMKERKLASAPASKPKPKQEKAPVRNTANYDTGTGTDTSYSYAYSHPF